jgi:hypothetical protein
MDLLKTISFTPEWVQAIASVFGVIGLLITIIIQSVTVRIQAKTSALQAEQIFRDKDVQRCKLLPYFSVSVVSWGDEVTTKTLTLKLIDNDINMVVLEAGKDLPILLSFTLDFSAFEKAGKQFDYTFVWLNHENKFQVYKVIQIEYADLLGNYYNQTVKLLDENFTITPPTINYQYQIEYLNSKKLINRIKSVFKKKKQITSIFPSEN